MVRVTADLIYRCPQYFNPVRERELDLRGNKIAVIENMGATEDQFDSIDLSDNEIVKLENFPYLKRLTTLLINNNRIARINPNVGEFLPKLQTLVLTNNRLVNLVDLDPLAALVNLQTLSLLDNIVTKKPNYRLYVINKLKKLRLLDFRKVKKKERLEAEKMFASKEAEEEARKEPAKTFTPGEVPTVLETPIEDQAPKAVAPTPEQILAIKAAIANSQTLEEVARLEKALKSGQLPADLNISGDDVKMDPAKNKPDEEMITENQNNTSEKINEDNENAVDAKIVPSSPASSHEKQKQWRRRALLAVICSTILLVGVIYVAIRLTPDEESGHNRIRSSDLDCKLCNSTSHYDLGISAFVREVCNSTFHYDLCVSSLSSCLGSLEANMSELAKFSVEVSRDDAIRVTCFVVELKEAAEDESRGALEDCTQLLEDTVDQLNTSVSVLAEQDWKQRIDDLTTWLSAALTNPSTCSEGFEDVGVSMNETMKQKIERVTDLVSDALAIVSFVSDLENSMENDP